MKISSAIIFAAGCQLASAAYSGIAADIRPHNFFDSFDFFTGADPTRGFVDYIDRNSAQQRGLIKTGSNDVYIGVDNTNQAPNGRASVRLESKQRFTRGLFILDLQHMPGGCGTWPAFWTFGDNWPNNGEIDIIEGVHEQTGNHVALHTSDNCSVDYSPQTSNVLTRNCFVNAPGQSSNQGCASQDPRPNSYGAGFNAGGGGVYATEWTADFIKVWFFPRGSIPGDALGPNPEPASWGTPAAMFKGSCDINSKFNSHKIVFNITFCGEWAGNTWGSSGCQARADSCNNFVAWNPSQFSETYWTINSLRVFSH